MGARRRPKHIKRKFSLVRVVCVIFAVMVLYAAFRFGAIDKIKTIFSDKTVTFEDVAPKEDVFADEAQETSEVSFLPSDTEALYYAYSQLSDDDQEKYDSLLFALEQRTSEDYPDSDLDDLTRIYGLVMADHPELFYVEGINLEMSTHEVLGIETKTDCAVQGSYTYSEEEISLLQSRIDAVVDAFLASVSQETDDYYKAKAAYEFVIKNTVYDLTVYEEFSAGSESMEGQTIVDVFINGTSVCGGYARAFQYLLQKMDIECVCVEGYAGGDSHAWCLAFLDGEWYYIDPTWGDPYVMGSDGEDQDSGRVSYAYLCLTDKDMALTHTPDVTYTLPECTSTADNYYLREGLWFWDANTDGVSELFAQADAEGIRHVEFRCADSTIYETISKNLIEDQGIFNYISSAQYTYSLNDDLLIFSFNW